MEKSIDTVLDTPFVKTLTQSVCGRDYQIVSRPAAYVVKPEQEDERNINRVIVLPPKGYMGNAVNQTNCFHGVESATIQIIGAVREEKKAFSKVKSCLLIAAFNDAAAVSDLDKPYLEFDVNDPSQGFVYNTRSAGEPPFHVVKVDGTGFYHTLVNLSDDWLVLKLHKVMRPEKTVALEQHLSYLQTEQANTLREFHAQIVQHGDELFSKNPALISRVVQMPPSATLPALGEMLYTRDTGKHETCTAFATILKIGNIAPEETTAFLQEKLQSNSIPPFFGKQLIEKIAKMQPAVQAIAPIAEVA